MKTTERISTFHRKNYHTLPTEVALYTPVSTDIHTSLLQLLGISKPAYNFVRTANNYNLYKYDKNTEKYHLIDSLQEFDHPQNLTHTIVNYVSDKHTQKIGNITLQSYLADNKIINTNIEKTLDINIETA